MHDGTARGRAIGLIELTILFMGVRLVKDINPAGSSSPNELISIGGLLFFSAELGATVSPDDNSEVDDQDSGESVDTETEPDTSNPSSDSNTAPSGVVGLMRSDGTTNGTTILKSFNSVSNLVQSGNKLYFMKNIHFAICLTIHVIWSN